MAIGFSILVAGAMVALAYGIVAADRALRRRR
jgi:hypothetical protein